MYLDIVIDINLIKSVTTNNIFQTIVKKGNCFDDVKDDKNVNNCNSGKNFTTVNAA